MSQALPRPPRRAYRSSEDAVLGGVAAGLAEHLGLDVMVVRVFFVATGLFGLGVMLYALLWLVLPLGDPDRTTAPGLAAASRQGRRGRRRVLRDAGPLVAFGVLAVGLLGLVEATIGGPSILWPLLVAALGVAVLWLQADEAQRSRWWDGRDPAGPRRFVLGDAGPASYARLAVGVGLVVTAFLLFAVQRGGGVVAGEVLTAALLGVGGVTLIVFPWVLRLASDLAGEREARIRTQERADVAAHLHDSVLQTLALIQRSAGDPAQVTRLARAQERDLRQWLFQGPAAAGDSLASALRSAAAEVEDAHGVPVEVVIVGDRPVREVDQALVLAAREAIVNAAKHSGAPRVDVFAEIGEPGAEVFVRDRGAGFDPDAVPSDRLGLRESVQARMQRHHGYAVVRTAPGQGTEVRLGTTPAPAGSATKETS